MKINEKTQKMQGTFSCDSILIGSNCGAHTFPYIDVKNSSAQMEHEEQHPILVKINYFIVIKEVFLLMTQFL